MFSCKLFEIFNKDDFAEHVRSYSQENTGDGALFRAVADRWAYSFSKKDLITDVFL